MKQVKLPITIRDRVVGLRRVRADDLVPNPKNWRRHPQAQSDAMRGVLAEIGFAGAELARELPDGSLMLIDGRLRADIAGEQPVPVLVLDLDEAEAAKLLLTFDSLSAMAEADTKALDALLREVETGDEALAKMLADLGRYAGCDWAKEQEAPVDTSPQLGAALQYKIIVDCATEVQQAELLERFYKERLQCKAMII